MWFTTRYFQITVHFLFDIQTWLLSGRRATVTPEYCNVRIFGRSCKSLKRRIKEEEAEIRAFEERKLDQN